MEQLVVILWRDASFHHDDTELPTEYLCQTAGWIIAEDATFITIAAERLPDGHRAVTMIPAATVLEMTILERAPDIRLPARNTSGLEGVPA